jgi:hypothetical protein
MNAVLDLFTRRPFERSPFVMPELVGMLGFDEARLFHWLAADYFSGAGTIVDAGSFVGKSAYCFATGLRANPRHRLARDKVHCFDLFRVLDDQTSDFLFTMTGERLALGASTRHVFERQVAGVRDLLEVHEGDLHAVTWPRQPIEILMIDVAKTEDLSRRVVDLFFRDLVPGRTIVVQQDYHHPWLPHIHVLMEFLAPCFRMVVSRASDSAAFLCTAPVQGELLERALAYDFDFATQCELMDRALKRLPVADRGCVELARLVLLGRGGDGRDLLRELARVRAQHFGVGAEPLGLEYLRQVTSFLRGLAAAAHAQSGRHEAVLALADEMLADAPGDGGAHVMRGMALTTMGRLAAGEDALRTALRCSGSPHWNRSELVRNLLLQRRLEDAEREAVDALRAGASPAARQACFDILVQVWYAFGDVDRATRALDRLRGEFDGDGEFHRAEALLHAVTRDRIAANRSLARARQLGITAERARAVITALDGA